MLILAGPRFNLLGEGSLSVTSENPRLLKANLLDGDPGVPWQAGTLATPQSIVLDGNLVQNTNGSFETAGAGGEPFAMWKKIETGMGAVTRVSAGGGNPTPPSGGGTWMCKCTKSNQNDAAAIMVDFYVRSGAYVALPVWGYDMTVVGVIRVQNLDTGNFLQNVVPLGEVWASAIDSSYFAGPGGQWIQTGFFSGGGFPGGFASGPPIHIEPVNQTKRSYTRIRLLIGLPAGVPSTTGWIDLFRIFYGMDFASLHHHTIPTGTVVTVDSSVAGGIWTTRAEFHQVPLAQPECYASFAREYFQFWRFNLAAFLPHGAVAGFLSAPGIGEAVLGQAVEMQGSWRSVDRQWAMAQTRIGQGDRYRQALQAGEVPRIVLERTDPQTKSFPEAIEVFRTSLGGVRPVIVAWDEALATRVIYGFVDERFGGKLDIHRAGTPHQIGITGFAPPLWTP